MKNVIINLSFKNETEGFFFASYHMLSDVIIYFLPFFSPSFFLSFFLSFFFFFFFSSLFLLLYLFFFFFSFFSEPSYISEWHGAQLSHLPPGDSLWLTVTYCDCCCCCSCYLTVIVTVIARVIVIIMATILVGVLIFSLVTILHHYIFYIFFQLFAAPDDIKNSLHLTDLNCSHFRYTGMGDLKTTSIEGVSDGVRFSQTMQVLELLGVGAEIQKDLQRILAGILYLGQVR